MIQAQPPPPSLRAPSATIVAAMTGASVTSWVTVSRLRLSPSARISQVTVVKPSSTWDGSKCMR